MSEIGVAILGDIVLDRYMAGTTERVSREAPIPVVVCKDETDNLGGAGNVVMNLRGLGARVFVAGSVGRDEYACAVRRHLSENGVESRLFDRVSPTLTKARLLCGGQQVARFDRETVEELPQKDAVSALSWLEDILDKKRASAVILSDYGLGFCTRFLCEAVIDAARSRNIPVFVDPRGSDWSRYKGATIATPNLAELSAVAGPVRNEDETVAASGEKARVAAGLDYLLVTRSSSGVSLMAQSGALHIPGRPIEVFDVSGAGDTVIACLAAAFAAGFSMTEAAMFANDAAHIVVTRSGTYPINARDILSGNAERTSEAIVVTRQDAASICERWKKDGRVVFTNGCFDVLHAGHVDSLERARALGERLIVGLNSDRSVRALKGKERPVNNEHDRARVLAALRCVDLVVVFDEDTPRELLSALRPHVLVKGGDYSAESLPGREFVETVVILPLTEGLSTTEIIKRTLVTRQTKDTSIFLRGGSS
ncbi:bifunctional protein HldE [Synergistales bacterium]|nr:bifunctional protein HldE [Synergistales bacterium]